MPRAKKVVKNLNMEQETVQFVVKVNDTFYLDWKGDDWTENLLYAHRFRKANEADGWITKVKTSHPDMNVRICRVWIGFVVSEL